MANKRYTADDIKIVNVDDHLRKHQEMYFGSRGANPESIASSIAEGALTLGARRTMVTESDGWWFVCADVDWLPAARIKGDHDESVFGCLYAFPEAGVNWHRSEIMTRVFSDQAFSVSGDQIFRVKDGPLTDDEILGKIAELGSWGRVIGFHFNAEDS